MPPPDRDGPNPYAPPARDGGDFVPRPVTVVVNGPLFSPMQIGVAAVFGSIVGGALLLQANYRAMREARAANIVIAGAVLATALLYLAVMTVHSPIATLAINAVAIVTFCVAAANLQRDLYTDHVLGGGARGSSWWVLGAILVSLAARAVTTYALGLIIRALGRRI